MSPETDHGQAPATGLGSPSPETGHQNVDEGFTTTAQPKTDGAVGAGAPLTTLEFLGAVQRVREAGLRLCSMAKAAEMNYRWHGELSALTDLLDAFDVET